MTTMDRDFAVIMGTAALVMACLIGVGVVLNEKECSTRAEMMGMESSWGPIQGCMVKSDGRWVPMSSVRLFVQEGE